MSAHSSASETRLNAVLWAGVLAGPVAWLVHLQTVYVLAVWACGGRGRAALHLVTLLCLAVTAAGIASAWRRWRSVGEWPSDWGHGRESRVRMLSVLGLLAGTLFALALVAQWFAVLLLDPCPT